MLSMYFKREEFACKCGCGFDTVDAQLLLVLEQLRYRFDEPVIITSGCRCEEHNKNVGGVKNSQHTLGRAADIQVLGVDPVEVQAFLDVAYPDSLGIGRYNTFTHIDTRSGYSRWRG